MPVKKTVHRGRAKKRGTKTTKHGVKRKRTLSIGVSKSRRSGIKVARRRRGIKSR